MHADDQARLADLETHVQALDILLRRLYVRWAVETGDDPEGAALRIIDGAIDYVRAIAKLEGSEEGRIFDSMEDHIRNFRENVDIAVEDWVLDREPIPAEAAGGAARKLRRKTAKPEE